MTRRKREISLATIGLLASLAWIPVHAQSVSEHFEDLAGVNATAGSTADVTFKVQGCSPGLDSLQMTKAYAVSASGANVARDVAEGLCDDQILNGAPACTTLGGAAITCAAAFPDAPGATTAVACNCDGVAGNDFSISVASNGVTIAPEGATPRVKPLHCKTTGGNNGHGPDLLPRTLVRIVPGGTGNLDFSVIGAPGPGLNPFTVSTTGKTDAELHDAICAGYAALGITAVRRSSATSDISILPADFSGYFLELRYPQGVTQFTVKRQVGTSSQTIVTETNAEGLVVAPAVPTMSAWGMMALVALLLLAGSWMLRRRQRTVSV